MVVIGVLALGVIGTLYFTLQISIRLDEQEHELREVLNALQRSRDALKDLQAHRSRFMQTAAHQLKSPLASVQTLASLIHDGIVPMDTVKSTCGRMIARCREGIQQVGELLALARVQESDPRQQPQSVTDVGQTIREVCRKYAPLAGQKSLALRYELPADNASLARVNEAGLADCLSNLIDNAIKYSLEPGEVSVKVTSENHAAAETADTPAPRFVSVTVTDHGIGIPPESLPADCGAEATGSVFDAFRRANNALAAGITGSGLGLAIVREVVERAGGRIAIRSDSEHGTTVTVSFPSATSSPVEPETPG